jgi:hypothetical protein
MNAMSEAAPLMFKNKTQSSLDVSVVCVDCRHIFQAGPETCPACNRQTFIYLNGDEDPNAVCDALIVIAGRAQKKSGKSQPHLAAR